MKCGMDEATQILKEGDFVRIHQNGSNQHCGRGKIVKILNGVLAEILPLGRHRKTEYIRLPYLTYWKAKNQEVADANSYVIFDGSRNLYWDGNYFVTDFRESKKYTKIGASRIFNTLKYLAGNPIIRPFSEVVGEYQKSLENEKVKEAADTVARLARATKLQELIAEYTQLANEANAQVTVYKNELRTLEV